MPVDIRKGDLFGRTALGGDPIANRGNVLGTMRAGRVQKLGGISRCTRMIRALQKAEALSTDMDVSDRLGIFYPHTAIRGSEEIISASIGKLDFDVLEHQRCVFGQQNGIIQKPPIALAIHLTRGNDNDPIRPSAKDGIV